MRKRSHFNVTFVTKITLRKGILKHTSNWFMNEKKQLQCAICDYKLLKKRCNGETQGISTWRVKKYRLRCQNIIFLYCLKVFQFWINDNNRSNVELHLSIFFSVWQLSSLNKCFFNNQKGLLDLSFPQTDEPNYFPELKFRSFFYFILNGLNHVKKGLEAALFALSKPWRSI